MKERLTKGLCLLLLGVLLAGCTAPSNTNPAAQTQAVALTKEELPAFLTAWVQQWIDGEYESVMADDMPIHAELRAAIDQYGGAEGYMNAIAAQTGQWLSVTPVAYGANQDEYDIYSAVLTGEKGVFLLMLVVDEAMQIAGLQLRPGAEEPIAMPEGFVETTVTVDAGEGFPLEGRLVMPENAAQAVSAILLVQGSGATDYDEIVGVNRVFGKVARGLAEQGIATLRYTKRNYAYPEIMQEQDYTVQDEYVRDVLTAVEMLRAQEGVGDVYLLGHSQGGMLAPMFVDAGADVDGMILFAGTPRSFFEIFETQQADLVAGYEAAGIQDAVNEYKALQEVWRDERAALEAATAEEAKAMGTVYTMGAYYLYDLLDYDSISLIKEQKLPTLILQGSADRQVTVEDDYALYERELGSEAYVEMHLYDGLSHLFTPSEAEDLLLATSEYNIAMDIPAQVFEDIAAWVAAQGK
jgi:dienelactone hydrolase